MKAVKRITSAASKAVMAVTVLSAITMIAAWSWSPALAAFAGVMLLLSIFAQWFIYDYNEQVKKEEFNAYYSRLKKD